MFTILIALILAVLFSLKSQKHSIQWDKYYLVKSRCDILKAILPFAIVLAHLSFYTHNPIIQNFRYSGPYVVGLFFFISGYGLEYKYHNNGLDFSMFPHRVKKLLTPLIFPIVLYLVLLHCFQYDVLTTIHANFTTFSLFIPYTWFVVVLLILNTVFYAVRRYFRSNTKMYAALFVITTIFLAVLYLNGIDGTTYVSNYAFLLGIFYNNNEKNTFIWLGHKKNCWYILAAFFVLAVCSSAYISGKPPFHGFALIGVTAYVLPFAFIFSFIKVVINKVLSFLSNISYEVYIVQGVTFVLFENLIKGEYHLLIVLAFILVNTLLAYISKRITLRIEKKL